MALKNVELALNEVSAIRGLLAVLHSLHNALAIESKAFFLGEKLRIRKISSTSSDFGINFKAIHI